MKVLPILLLTYLISLSITVHAQSNEKVMLMNNMLNPPGAEYGSKITSEEWWKKFPTLNHKHVKPIFKGGYLIGINIYKSKGIEWLQQYYDPENAFAYVWEKMENKRKNNNLHLDFHEYHDSTGRKMDISGSRTYYGELYFKWPDQSWYKSTGDKKLEDLAGYSKEHLKELLNLPFFTYGQSVDRNRLNSFFPDYIKNAKRYKWETYNQSLSYSSDQPYISHFNLTTEESKMIKFMVGSKLMADWLYEKTGSEIFKWMGIFIENAEYESYLDPESKSQLFIYEDDNDRKVQVNVRMISNRIVVEVIYAEHKKTDPSSKKYDNLYSALANSLFIMQGQSDYKSPPIKNVGELKNAYNVSFGSAKATIFHVIFNSTSDAATYQESVEHWISTSKMEAVEDVREFRQQWRGVCGDCADYMSEISKPFAQVLHYNIDKNVFVVFGNDQSATYLGTSLNSELEKVLKSLCVLCR